MWLTFFCLYTHNMYRVIWFFLQKSTMKRKRFHWWWNPCCMFCRFTFSLPLHLWSLLSKGFINVHSRALVINAAAAFFVQVPTFWFILIFSTLIFRDILEFLFWKDGEKWGYHNLDLKSFSYNQKILPLNLHNQNLILFFVWY